MLIEADLELPDGRTLHVYDAGADGAGARLAVVWQHGTPTSESHPRPCFRPLASAMSGGCHTTGQDTADRLRYPAAAWHRPPPTVPGSPTRWASVSSP